VCSSDLPAATATCVGGQTVGIGALTVGIGALTVGIGALLWPSCLQPMIVCFFCKQQRQRRVQCADWRTASGRRQARPLRAAGDVAMSHDVCQTWVFLW